jgi:hypothetical protein
MNPILRNIIAVAAGSIIGGMVNGLIINFSGVIIPYPSGYDHSSEEAMKASIHLLENKHYIMPFLAHALGTLIGAIVACKIAATHHFNIVLIVAGLFFSGGFYMVKTLSAPMWFNLLDLVGAYFPMAWIGYKLSAKK